MSHTPAKPGKPGQHNGRRLRFRTVARETRRTNRDAVARIAEAEIAMKERVVRSVVRARLLQAAIIAVGVAAAIVVRCAL